MSFTGKKIAFLVVVIFISTSSIYAQFYRGSSMDFGKNRLQFFEPNWQHMDFEDFNVYFYGTGRPLADYTAIEGQKTLKYLQQTLDYRIRDKVYILIYNTHSEFQQSNIGLELAEGNSMGGVTHLQGNKLFVYFNGTHEDLRKQIHGGLTEVIVRQMIYGNSWREMVKNSALLSLPNWYIPGLVSYATEPWSVEIDDQLRDIVLSGKIAKINRLSGPNAKFAGHAIWNYVAEVYGPEVFPNILYMSKISRNVESGFLFVLGQSLPSLIESAQKYYLAKYLADDASRGLPDSEPLKIKTKKSRSYQRISVSNDVKYIAYTSNELGQYKVWLHQVDKKKTKKIMKGNHKLDRIVDDSYPLLGWSPASDILAVIYEKKGKVLLDLYDVETKKWEKRELVRIDKALSFNYSHDGRRLVISGIKDSQSDLFVYELSQNSMRQVTNDIYDDLTPSFVPGTNKIIFASNRGSDSVKVKKDMDLMQKKTDLFLYDFKTKEKTYKRLVNTQDFDERIPYAINEKYFTFISGENGIKNRYIGTVDSTISSVDTAIHYRYFTKTTPVSNYKRNIIYHSFSLQEKKFAEMVRINGKYQFYLEDFKDVHAEKLNPTTFKESLEEKSKAQQRLANEHATQFTLISPTQRDIELSMGTTDKIDINNYAFEGDVKKNEAPTGPIKNSQLITLNIPESTIQKNKEETGFKFPKQENYRLAFSPTDVTTAVDFDFANQLYQPFNGGPYNNPGMGTVIKISVFDLMENHNFTGGMRYGLNGASTEYFFTYTNRKKRLDKTYGFQRQKLDQSLPEGYNVTSLIHQGKITLSYPFSTVFAMKGTASLRNDHSILKGINNQSLAADDINETWGGLKLELIFDNTRDIAMNIKNGMRFKIFAESYAEISNQFTDIQVIGADFRTYTKIHRNIVWANRLAGSTSFGRRKLVYYLGAVDEWISIGSGDRFNSQQNIARDQNYYWQALATNMRGFNQNIRNGNSFVVLNSELRIPIFQYLIAKPIKTEFIKTFQITGFADVGTAWTGFDPYSDANAFNTRTITSGGSNVTIRLNNKKDPLVGAVGFGFRSKILGYYLRYDYAWGMEDGRFLKPMGMLSMGLDF